MPPAIRCPECNKDVLDSEGNPIEELADSEYVRCRNCQIRFSGRDLKMRSVAGGSDSNVDDAAGEAQANLESAPHLEETNLAARRKDKLCGPMYGVPDGCGARNTESADRCANCKRPFPPEESAVVIHDEMDIQPHIPTAWERSRRTVFVVLFLLILGTVSYGLFTDQLHLRDEDSIRILKTYGPGESQIAIAPVGLTLTTVDEKPLIAYRDWSNPNNVHLEVITCGTKDCRGRWRQNDAPHRPVVKNGSPGLDAKIIAVDDGFFIVHRDQREESVGTPSKSDHLLLIASCARVTQCDRAETAIIDGALDPEALGKIGGEKGLELSKLLDDLLSTSKISEPLDEVKSNQIDVGHGMSIEEVNSVPVILYWDKAQGGTLKMAWLCGVNCGTKEEVVRDIATRDGRIIAALDRPALDSDTEPGPNRPYLFELATAIQRPEIGAGQPWIAYNTWFAGSDDRDLVIARCGGNFCLDFPDAGDNTRRYNLTNGINPAMAIDQISDSPIVVYGENSGSGAIKMVEIGLVAAGADGSGRKLAALAPTDIATVQGVPLVNGFDIAVGVLEEGKIVIAYRGNNLVEPSQSALYIAEVTCDEKKSTSSTCNPTSTVIDATPGAGYDLAMKVDGNVVHLVYTVRAESGLNATDRDQIPALKEIRYNRYTAR